MPADKINAETRRARRSAENSFCSLRDSAFFAPLRLVCISVKAVEGHRISPRREAFACNLRIARSVWSAPASAALSGGRRGWNGECFPCGQKAVLKSPQSRRSASSGDDQISRSVLECASPLALWNEDGRSTGWTESQRRAGGVGSATTKNYSFSKARVWKELHRANCDTTQKSSRARVRLTEVDTDLCNLPDRHTKHFQPPGR